MLYIEAGCFPSIAPTAGRYNTAELMTVSGATVCGYAVSKEEVCFWWPPSFLHPITDGSLDERHPSRISIVVGHKSVML